MWWSELRGEQYVRLAAGAAEAVAPYVHIRPGDIEELLIDLVQWPEGIRPAPVRGWDGRLIASDPVLLSADDTGLTFAAGRELQRRVVVPWDDVRRVQVVGRLQTGS